MCSVNVQTAHDSKRSDLAREGLAVSERQMDRGLDLAVCPLCGSFSVCFRFAFFCV